MSELRDRTFARWLVTDRDGAARACAGLAQTLTQLSASAADRGRTVATLWAQLRDRPVAMVSFRITDPGTTHRTGLLAVDDEIVAQVQLPTEAPGEAAGPSGAGVHPGLARHRGRSGRRAEPAPAGAGEHRPGPARPARRAGRSGRTAHPQQRAPPGAAGDRTGGPRRGGGGSHGGRSGPGPAGLPQPRGCRAGCLARSSAGAVPAVHAAGAQVRQPHPGVAGDRER